MSHFEGNISFQILCGEAKENVKQQQGSFPDRNPNLALTKYNSRTGCFIIHYTEVKLTYICDVIYLTAIGLKHVGHSTVHIYTQTLHRTTQFNINIIPITNILLIQ
jgi:hypothetical protein